MSQVPPATLSPPVSPTQVVVHSQTPSQIKLDIPLGVPSLATVNPQAIVIDGDIFVKVSFLSIHLHYITIFLSTDNSPSFR